MDKATLVFLSGFQPLVRPFPSSVLTTNWVLVVPEIESKPLHVPGKHSTIVLCP